VIVDRRSPGLGFVQFERHRRLLCEVLARAGDDPEVLGVLLKGSVARGDAYPGSDLDVQILLRQGSRSRAFLSEVREGTVVESSFADPEEARAKLARQPMWVYAYLDGHILYDPEGRLASLVALARARFEGYRAPAEERRRLAYWLQSARVKIVAAMEAGDVVKAAYVASTTSWPILEAIWAANDMPVPPSGAVWAHVGDLDKGPPEVEALLRRLFAGETADRVQAALEVVDWAVPALRESPEH
jgi:predicted nucleotidyltransferase